MTFTVAKKATDKRRDCERVRRSQGTFTVSPLCLILLLTVYYFIETQRQYLGDYHDRYVEKT